MPVPPAVVVGLDWGSTAHHLWVTDGAGTMLGHRVVAHNGAALLAATDWLVSLADGDPTRVVVAIEVPRGPVVETLLERGCEVFAINPKQVDRFRDRYSVAGAKDDRRDAQVLNHAWRTDAAVFRHLDVGDARTVELRECVRHDQELGEDLVRLTNRLRELLQRVWPEVLQLTPAADEPWLWALLARIPIPPERGRFHVSWIRQLLRRHRIRRFDAEQLVTVLRTPSVHLAPGTRDGVAMRIADLVAQLSVLHRQRRQAERRLTDILASMTDDRPEHGREHHDGQILQSLPGIGLRIAATMLAEAADVLRTRDYHALRVLAGIAPVTKQSGKRHMVCMRYACNHRLQTAMYWWGQNALRIDPRSRAHYQRLRRGGHSRARAIRGITDRLLAVLIAALKTDTVYDAARRPVRETAA